MFIEFELERKKWLGKNALQKSYIIGLGKGIMDYYIFKKSKRSNPDSILILKVTSYQSESFSPEMYMLLHKS